MHTIDRCSILRSFLRGTCDKNSPLQILRGQSDVLRYIWTLLCEEWWLLHINFVSNRLIPDFSANIPGYLPVERQLCSDCPVAAIAKNIYFPSPLGLSVDSHSSGSAAHLFIEMMPFDFTDISTLPGFCSQYKPMIAACLNRVFEDPNIRKKTGFLTIDERPTINNHLSRKNGFIQVGTTGLTRTDDEISLHYNKNGLFTPAVLRQTKHSRLFRKEKFEGGFFMSVNTPESINIWTCQIDDFDDDMIRQNSNVERYRELLGRPSRCLAVGEVVWMTDATPYEQIPLKPGNRRQFFQLFIRDASVWRPERWTKNPLGFDVYSSKEERKGEGFFRRKVLSWKYGTPREIEMKTEERELRFQLKRYCLGHIANKLISFGIRSIHDLLNFFEVSVDFQYDNMRKLCSRFSDFIHDTAQFEVFLSNMRQKYGKGN